MFQTTLFVAYRMPWRRLPPFSAHGFVRQDLLAAAPRQQAEQQLLLQERQPEPLHQQQQPVKVEICGAEGAVHRLMPCTQDLCALAARACG